MPLKTMQQKILLQIASCLLHCISSYQLMHCKLPLQLCMDHNMATKQDMLKIQLEMIPLFRFCILGCYGVVENIFIHDKKYSQKNYNDCSHDSEV